MKNSVAINDDDLRSGLSVKGGNFRINQWTEYVTWNIEIWYVTEEC